VEDQRLVVAKRHEPWAQASRASRRTALVVKLSVQCRTAYHATTAGIRDRYQPLAAQAMTARAGSGGDGSRLPSGLPVPAEGLQAALGGIATAAVHETQAVAIEGISWTLGSVSNPAGGSKGRASRTAPLFESC
jgi:hypothetical protein